MQYMQLIMQYIAFIKPTDPTRATGSIMKLDVTVANFFSVD